MKQLTFYRLNHVPLEKVLPALLTKIYDQQKYTTVRVPTPEAVQRVDQFLWTYNPLSFLPHGCALTSEDPPEAHPIWITTALENLNQSEILVNIEGVELTQDVPFARVLYLFNPAAEALPAQQAYEWAQQQAWECLFWQHIGHQWQQTDPDFSP